MLISVLINGVWVGKKDLTLALSWGEARQVGPPVGGVVTQVAFIVSGGEGARRWMYDVGDGNGSRKDWFISVGVVAVVVLQCCCR